MTTNYLNKLEFYKILEIVANFSTTYIGKDLILNLKPKFTKSEVEKSLSETR